MSTQMKNLVAVLPDGTEHFADVRVYGQRVTTEYRQVAEDAVRKAGLTTSRKDPQTVKVKVFVLGILKGAIHRESAGQYDITPPLERMTEQEYAEEMKEILADLPEAFRSYVESEAYEDGHSAGYEEVVTLARNMASSLKRPIAEYTESLKKRK